MINIIVSIVLVLLIIYVVPILVYGLFSKVIQVKMPKDISPIRFLLSVLISKIGTAVTFVLLFSLARTSLNGQWFIYAGVWWLMFVIGEIGQSIGPHYSWKEALAGVVSETVYLPLSAFVVDWLV